MSLKQIVFFFIILTALSCTSGKKLMRYTRDYIEVGKIMDSVKLPYRVKVKEGKKQLLAIGVSHTYDSNNCQIPMIKDEFSRFNPDVIIHEGGPINKQFEHEGNAISSNGEAGLLKYLCDLAHKDLLDGDVEDSLEYSVMLQKYSQDDLLLYYIMERLIIPHLNGAYGDRNISDLYDLAIKKWFITAHFPVEQDLKTFTGFQQLYRSKIGHDLKLSNGHDLEFFDYVNPDCKYCEIGRRSKMLRDSCLLDHIQYALKKYDKVMVVFGHGHILAIEPALQKIMKK